MEHNEWSCSRVREYIDGLSQRQIRQDMNSGPMYDHVRQCKTCQIHFDRAKNLSDHLDQWTVPPPGQNITAGVMAQIAQLEKDTKTEPLGFWSRLPALCTLRLRVPAAAAAAVIVLLIISVSLNIAKFGDTGEPGKGILVQGDSEQNQPQIIQVSSDGREQLCFFGIDPRSATTPLVIILGAPGVVPVETKPQLVSDNSSNRPL